MKVEPLKSRTPLADERAGDHETMMAPVCARGTWIAKSFVGATYGADHNDVYCGSMGSG